MAYQHLRLYGEGISVQSLIQNTGQARDQFHEASRRNAAPPLRERLRTHKVFTKDQCFYLYYSKFSLKSYVLDVY